MSRDQRYFNPFDNDHPLKDRGARNYRGQICDCEQGAKSWCDFHYPNGQPGDETGENCANCRAYGFPCTDDCQKLANTITSRLDPNTL